MGFGYVCDELYAVVRVFSGFFFFFFKQKTAYEMRISDWSSDVCSSDLSYSHVPARGAGAPSGDATAKAHAGTRMSQPITARCGVASIDEIGRASCRERVCQYV